MTAQLDVFDATWRQARTADPSTSAEAATRNATGLILQREAVEAALEALGSVGGTSYAVAAYMTSAMGVPTTHVQAGRRLYELGEMKRAVVIWRGESPAGDTCRVWRHARYGETG